MVSIKNLSLIVLLLCVLHGLVRADVAESGLNSVGLKATLTTIDDSLCLDLVAVCFWLAILNSAPAFSVWLLPYVSHFALQLAWPE